MDTPEENAQDTRRSESGRTSRIQARVPAKLCKRQTCEISSLPELYVNLQITDGKSLDFSHKKLAFAKKITNP